MGVSLQFGVKITVNYFSTDGFISSPRVAKHMTIIVKPCVHYCLVKSNAEIRVNKHFICSPMPRDRNNMRDVIFTRLLLENG